MIGASKILTVSYGTFSCTLEGFDDPFNTMKAIAEYFRDLAAEDRYFGAEPPTPDAAMLHRIAEREVQRRVEAKVQENGVILRAQNDAPISAPVTAPVETSHDAPVPAAVTAVVVTQDSAVVTPEPIVSEVPAAIEEMMNLDEADIADEATIADAGFVEAVADIAPEIWSQDDAAPLGLAPADVADAEPVRPSLSDMPEGVAARLAKIRAAVALTEPTAVSAPAALSEYAEDQHADEAFAAFDVYSETDAPAVSPSLSDASFAAPEDADESDDLAALDGIDLADVAADMTDELSEQVAEPATVDLYEDDLVEDLPAQDAFAEAVGTDDLEDALLTEAAADTEEDLPVAEPAFTDDHADDVLANLSAAFAEDRAEEPANTAEPVLLDDEDDLVLQDLVDDADDIALEAAIDPEADGQDELSDGLTASAEVDAFAEQAADNLTDADFADDDEFTPVTNEASTAVNDDLAVTTADDAADLPGLAADAPEAPAAEEPAMVVAAQTADPEPALSEKAQRARARIIRVRRSPEIAIAPAAAPVSAPVVLSDDAEAELQRELAALEEAEADFDAPVALPEAETVVAAEEPETDADDDLRRQLSSLGLDQDQPTDKSDTVPTTGAAALDPTVQDDALRRLMDQTQSEMAEPSNRRRLSSIAHLKAAVAATIAERFGTKPKPAEEVEAVRAEPYRNDLARAVRPVRPVAGSGTPNAERSTPLVLVSEQRIDRPAPITSAPAHVTPVRPRRVSAQAVAVQESYDEDDFDVEDDDTDNIFGDSKGFAEFADRIGATYLSELLEAAAAYSSAVEGREHFTRPQLLRQISAVTGTEVSREDELRGFGSLLRDGRIVKVKRGQFALSDQSTYLDEARKIAG
ncbi:MAG: hypothetical protein ACRCS3_10915 [Paracoccaceae bacterium]